MLIRTARRLMLEDAAVRRGLRGRPHLRPMKSDLIFDLFPLFLRHAPKFNGFEQIQEFYRDYIGSLQKLDQIIILKLLYYIKNTICLNNII